MSNAELVECVPNVSEGQRREVIDRLSDAAASVAGARLVDVHSDADHHRSVFTIVGGPDAVEESVLRLAAVAVEYIDLRQHQGADPVAVGLDHASEPLVDERETVVRPDSLADHDVSTRHASSLLLRLR